MRLPDPAPAWRPERRLVLTAAQHAQLLGALFPDEREAFAVLFCGSSDTNARERMLAREVWVAPDAAYRVRERDRLEIMPAYLNDVVTHALAGRWHVVLVHSHPGGDPAYFSRADDTGDARLLRVLAQLLPGRRVASAVVTMTDMVARSLAAAASGDRLAAGTVFDTFDSVDVFGAVSRRFGGPAFDRVDDTTRALLDRQVRAVGVAAQGRLATLRVGVVGAGGTGSATLEQLVRSGILDLLLIDPDRFAPSNWGRVWGSRAAHAAGNDGEGWPLKVSLQAEHLRAIHPGVRLRVIADSVVNEEVLRELRDCDVVFCCTDNHLSRAMLNRFAHQHLVPVVDMGIRLDARRGFVSAASGRVSVVGPGLACLRCGQHLSAEQLRAESMPAAERARLAREGYVMGLPESAPSVISLNTTVASLAVTACLAMFAGLTASAPPATLIYDATAWQLFAVEPRHEEGCDVCAPGGIASVGDADRVSAYDDHHLN